MYAVTADLKAWLKAKGLNVSAKEAEKLFEFGYTDAMRLLAASADDFQQGGLPLPLSRALMQVLQKPPAKYSLFGEMHTTMATTVEELLQSIPQKYPLVVLDSGRPLGGESLLNSDPTYHVAYDFSFPKEFKAQPEHKEPDHPIVAMEPVIAKAMKHVHENISKSINGGFRVPPIMIASLARSGKTLTLMQLFNAILREGKYMPIFLTFNGFKRNRDASDVEDFLRGACTQLHPGTIPSGEDIYTYFSRQRLEEYLGSAGKPVVLLVDELNALSPQPSVELMALLREMFLDPEGRFLCFTSHQRIDLSEVGAFNDELGIAKASDRSWLPVEVARTLDLGALRTLVPDLQPFEAYLYSGLPGLVCSWKREIYEAQLRLSKRVSPDFVADHLDSILEQVCTGDNYTSSAFAEFTLTDERKRLVWPWCYVQACFAHLPVQRRRDDLRSLIDGVPHLGCEGDGAPEYVLWEYTVRAALALVASYGTPAQKALLGELPAEYQVTILRIPRDQQTLDQAKAWIDERVASTKLATNSQSIVALAFPMYENFSPFDGIIRCSSPQFSSWRGVQMKLDNDYPDVDCSEDFPGILIRRFAPEIAGFPRHQNWTDLTYAEIETFLPYSMRQFIPRGWKPEDKTD